jgi:hypothetical protein
MDNNFFTINKQDFYRGRINNDQTINERNKVVEDFMNDMDDKNNENNNLEDEEEDDFDKIENEYMRKKNEEANKKYYDDFNQIKENEEKEIIYDKNNRKTNYDFYNNEENNKKSNCPKQFFPRLFQNPENLYLIEAYKMKEKHKIKKIFERKIKDENNKININLEKDKSKEKQNIRIFKKTKKKESHSLSKNKIKNKNLKKEDTKNQEENNISFEENEILFSKYKNNKKGIKSGKPSYNRNNIIDKLNNFNNPYSTLWNNKLNNIIDIKNYEKSRLKSDFFLPKIKSERNENLLNNNNTFTIFNIKRKKNNCLNQKSKSNSKNKNLKRNFDDYNINNNKIQFDVILNHFKKEL